MQRVLISGIANCGKTSLFNNLTGKSERVGNWQGVTTQTKSAICENINGNKIEICDLPGSYLSGEFTLEDKNAMEWAKGECVVIILCEAVNILKSKSVINYFKSKNIPFALIINMNSELEKKGGYINEGYLLEECNIIAVKAECNSKKGVEKVKKVINYLITQKLNEADLASFEKDEKWFKKPKVKTKLNFLDKILLNGFCVALFSVALWVAVLYLAFGEKGFGNMLCFAFDKLLICAVNQPIERLLSFFSANSFIKLFILEGFLKGIFSVLLFLPRLLIVHLFITLLEESGVLARIAFTLNGVFSKAGISGRALFALLSGYGCTVSAVLACNGLENKTVKNRVIGALSYISCSAKTPVYLYLLSMLSKSAGFFVIPLFYGGGFLLALSYCYVHSKIFKRNPQPLIIEFPPYRIPKFKSLLKALQKFTKGFIIKTGSVIATVSALMWLISNLSLRLEFLTYNQQEESILAIIAKEIAILFKPVGLGDYKIISALFAGLIAKEGIISSLALFGVESLTFKQGISLLIFCFIYPPCASAMSAIYKQSGLLNAIFIFFFQLALAYLLSLAFCKPKTIFLILLAIISFMAVGVFIKRFKRKQSCVNCVGCGCEKCKSLKLK